MTQVPERITTAGARHSEVPEGTTVLQELLSHTSACGVNHRVTSTGPAQTAVNFTNTHTSPRGVTLTQQLEAHKVNDCEGQSPPRQRSDASGRHLTVLSKGQKVT